MKTLFLRFDPPLPPSNVWEVNNPPRAYPVVEPRPAWWTPNEEAYPMGEYETFQTSDFPLGLTSGVEAQLIECWDWGDGPSGTAYEYQVMTPPVLPQT